VAEPDVAVVPSSHDVAFVGGSIFVHAYVPIDVHTTIDVNVSTSVYVNMSTSIYMRGAMMAAPTVVTSTASAVAFRVRCHHDSKAERRRNRKNETNLLQHFCFSSLR
jgi:hypothetical protein